MGALGRVASSCSTFEGGQLNASVFYEPRGQEEKALLTLSETNVDKKIQKNYQNRKRTTDPLASLKVLRVLSTDAVVKKPYGRLRKSR